MNVPVRVVVVDDQTLFRAALTKLLEEDGRVRVVGGAAGGDEALALIESEPPDVALVDLRLPGTDGVETTRRILSRHPGGRVLILTSYCSDRHIWDVMRAGASGYVLKDSTPTAIVNAIIAVMGGTRVMTRSVAERIMSVLCPAAGEGRSFEGLTEREVEILKLVAAGVANRQIAHRLGITEKTVRNRVSIIYRKLRLSDRSQIALYAVRTGLIQV